MPDEDKGAPDPASGEQPQEGVDPRGHEGKSPPRLQAAAMDLSAIVKLLASVRTLHSSISKDTAGISQAIQPPLLRPLPTAQVQSGEAMTPLKEAGGQIGISMQAGPTGSTKLLQEEANVLRLGGPKYPGRIVIGSAGAGAQSLLSGGPCIVLDGEKPRVRIHDGKRMAAYFGMAPLPSLVGPSPTGALEPALVFTDKTGNFSTSYADGVAMVRFVIASGVSIGGLSIAGQSPEGWLHVSGANPDSGVDVDGSNSTVALKALHVGGAKRGHGSIDVYNAEDEVAVQISAEAGDILLANADCAEEFDVEDDAELEPGTVAIVAASGKLRPCAHGYDTRVVGIVSGAGRFRPAMVLDRRAPSGGAQNQRPRRAPIALMGKVYCKVDARSTTVCPGDLLTTSELAGHAMALTQGGKSRATGAIIGKALESLSSGTGLIPVLVLRA